MTLPLPLYQPLNDPSLWDFTDASASPASFEDRKRARAFWFDKIAPKHNWKDRIDAWIAPEDFAGCDSAAIHFTGAGLEVMYGLAGERPGLIRVTAPGYYATIGA